MLGLRECQQAFLAQLNNPQAVCALPLSNPERAPLAMAIYRQTMLINQRQAVLSTYPALVCLLGEMCSQALVQRYLQQVPSRSGDLNSLAEGLPTFLATLSELDAWPYLADVARLEWALWQVETAADVAWTAASGDAAALADYGSDWRVLFDPAIRLLTSDYPLVTIWRMQCQPEQDPGPLDLHSPQIALVYRRQGQGRVASLEPWQAQLLAALDRGQTVGQALASLADAYVHDWGGWLQALACEGILQCVYRETVA